MCTEELVSNVPKIGTLDIPAIKKWLPFDLMNICAVSQNTQLHVIALPCSNLAIHQFSLVQTLYVLYIKKPTVKKWLVFDLISAVTIGMNYLIKPCVRCTQNGYIGHTSHKKWLPFDLIFAVTQNTQLATSLKALPCSNLVLHQFYQLLILGTPRTQPSKSVFHFTLYMQSLKLHSNLQQQGP